MADRSDPSRARDPYAAVNLADEASRLSDRLVELEAELGEIPFRIPSEVVAYSSQDGSSGVSFERVGGEWSLCWWSADASGEKSKQLLSQSSLVVKAQAAALLPKLLEKILTERNRRATELRRAHTALDTMPELLRKLRNPPVDPEMEGFDEVPF